MNTKSFDWKPPILVLHSYRHLELSDQLKKLYQKLGRAPREQFDIEVRDSAAGAAAAGIGQVYATKPPLDSLYILCQVEISNRPVVCVLTFKDASSTLDLEASLLIYQIEVCTYDELSELTAGHHILVDTADQLRSGKIVTIGEGLT